MHKNQLQELAQRSCFNLPSYSCIREGPDHAPRFKATVTFNGETFDSPGFCNTLRHAEHAAAEVALSVLSKRGTGESLATRVMDETGICKNLLQETAQRAGIELPVYSVERSGPAHMLVFTSTVELAGMTFTGESAKTKKQAEKNAAMAAWASLKQLVQEDKLSQQDSATDASEEQLQKIIARALMNGQKESYMQTSLPVPKAGTEVPRAAVKQRVQITPFQKESHMQTSLPVPKSGAEVPRAAVKQQVQATPFEKESHMQTSVPVVPKPGAKVPRATVNQRVKITPFEELSERQPSKNNHNHQKAVRSEKSSGASTNWNSQGPVQFYGMPMVFGSASHTNMISSNLQPEENNWVQCPSPFMVVNEQDLNLTGKIYPCFQSAYNPMVLVPGNQWISTVPISQANIMMGPFKTASSLASGVHVCQTAPVSPTPIILTEITDVNCDTATLQSLNELKL